MSSADVVARGSGDAGQRVFLLPEPAGTAGWRRTRSASGRSWSWSASVVVPPCRPCSSPGRPRWGGSAAASSRARASWLTKPGHGTICMPGMTCPGSTIANCTAPGPGCTGTAPKASSPACAGPSLAIITTSRGRIWSGMHRSRLGARIIDGWTTGIRSWPCPGWPCARRPRWTGAGTGSARSGECGAPHRPPLID